MPNIVLGPVRLSYIALLEPKPDDRGNMKYGCQVIIDKKDKKNLKILNDAIQQAFTEGKQMLGVKSDKMPAASASFKICLRDGDVDKPDDENLEGKMFFNANSNSKPQVVGRDPRELLVDPNEIYSGMWANISLTVKAFTADGNKSKGITAYLGNVQKVKDDTRFDGRKSASQEFETLEPYEDLDNSSEEDDDDLGF
jgi:hypothetical protein